MNSRTYLQLLASCLLVAFVALFSGTAWADVPPPTPVRPDDPRLINNWRASGDLITPPGPNSTPIRVERPTSATTSGTASAPSIVSRIRNFLTRPAPPLLNAVVNLPVQQAKGFGLEAWDFVKGTVGLVVNTDVVQVRALAGLATGNLGAAERAMNDSQVVHIVNTTVRGLTTGTRMVSAAVTDNREALVNAARESPMFPIVMEAGIQAPQIVNTIRSGTPEERAQLISEAGELSGRLSFEAALFAVPGGAEVRAPSLVTRTVRVEEELATAAEVAQAPLQLTQRVRLTQSGLDHIIERHWATSGERKVGKFTEGTTGRDLKSLVEEAVRSGTTRPATQGRPGKLIEYDFGRQIGINSSGKPASRLRVVVSPEGEVVTAFPY